MRDTTLFSGTYTSLYTFSGAGVTLVNLGTIGGSGVQASVYVANVVNGATIAGIDGTGVDLGAGGSLTNQAGGTITGRLAIYADGATDVLNAGTIVGGNNNGYGINLNAGGSVNNQSGGYIAARQGIQIGSASGTVCNAGIIRGSGSYGIGLAAGGLVNNQATGNIIGDDAVRISGGGTVVNAGGIRGIGAQKFGVLLVDGGSLTNQGGGVITGAQGVGVLNAVGTVVNEGSIGGGVYLQRGGTVIGTSIGSISGNAYAVRFGAGYASRLVLYAGTQLSGQAIGGNAPGGPAVSTLELASSAAAGTLGGLGYQYTSFTQVTVDSGAQWTLGGINTLAPGYGVTNAGTLTLYGATLSGGGMLTNNGVVVLDPSDATFADLDGDGVISIAAGSTLEVLGSIAATQTIVFGGGGASLRLDDPDLDYGPVTGFASNDNIDLVGVAPGSVRYGAGELSFAGGSFPLSSQVPLTFQPDGKNGTDIACFASGTRIATLDGPVAVEALRPGMLAWTAFGWLRRIVWIGVRSIDLARHPAPQRARPIRIRAGAIAEGTPLRDVRLSPDHAVFTDGLLIPAKLLHNGVSIVRDTDCRSITYYHVELDGHDVLLAEGLPAESYLDTGNRGMFQNAPLPLTLHPRFEDGQALREAESCAPFAADAGRVETVWRKLAARAADLGFIPEAEIETTGDPALCVMADGRTIGPAGDADECAVFLIPAGVNTVRLTSRTAAPNEQRPWIDDHRRMGVAVAGLTLHAGGMVETIPLDDPRLVSGWWDIEREGGRMWRWTAGSAELPVSLGGPAILRVRLAGTLAYPIRGSGRPEQRKTAPVLAIEMQNRGKHP